MDPDLPSLLRTYRTRLDITQVAAAEVVGVTKAAIWAYEAGKARPSPESLKTLAKLYRLAGDEAFGLFDAAGYVVRITPTEAQQSPSAA